MSRLIHFMFGMVGGVCFTIALADFYFGHFCAGVLALLTTASQLIASQFLIKQNVSSHPVGPVAQLQ
jgi:hypothetical protein